MIFDMENKTKGGMAMSDLFGNLGNLGNLGGLVKGLSGFMPQDDPNTQLFKLQSEVSDLKKQETELYTEIGRKAAAQYGLESFGENAEKMKLIQINLAAAENKLKEAQGIKAEREQAEKAAAAERTCSQCGRVNPEGTRFCQECGGKLGVQNLCPACGAQNGPNVKFCNQCGTSLKSSSAANCSACGTENPPGTRFCGGCGNPLGG